MKKHFQLHGLDEVKIWRDEAPVEPFFSQKVLSSELRTPPPQMQWTANEIVIELKQPRGPMCLYGLLGAKLHRSNDSTMSLRVGDGLLDPRYFSDSMIAQHEVPRYGLPKDAAGHILTTIEHEINERELRFNGAFEVCFGAHGDISSSIHVFKLIARALPRIAFRESLDLAFMSEVFSK